MEFVNVGLIVAAIIAFFIIILIMMSVKTVPQGYEYTVERFGKYSRTLKPGLSFLIPFLDNIGQRMNLRESVMDIPTQEVITRETPSSPLMVSFSIRS